MTLRVQEDFDTVEEYFDYLSQVQAEKNAQAEAEMLAREANQ